MNLFKGRYGFDKLSALMLLIGVLLLLWRYPISIGVILIGFALWRTLSKDFVSRGNEALKFQNWLNRTFKAGNAYNKSKPSFHSGIKGSANKVKDYFNEKKNFKIFKCQRCGQKLRVPRGKGKITVTCKKCGYEFKMKS